jgi:hypothetical protein
MRSFSLLFVFACASCGNPDPCGKDPASCQDAGNDSGGPGGGGPGSCVGVCAPPAPAEWFATSLLWVGATSTATPPTCPAVMPAPFPGFADTAPTVQCPSCACAPSTAQCLLPAQMSANPSVCPGGSGAKQFNPPAGWDGQCNATNPVSSADSLTVAPPASPFGRCDTVLTGPMNIQGSTPALECDGMPHVAAGTCGDQSMVCAFPNSDGFLTCIIKSGDNACPAGWPRRHLVYPNSQACGCVCGSPVGDSCSATVTVYSDGACFNPLGSAMVSSDQPQGCTDVAPGSALGSKSSTPPVYKAGTCAPSAIAEGTPVTFCCLP